MKLTGWQLAVIACVGILGIIGLEVIALLKGIDGVLLSGVIAIIAGLVAGLGGFKIARS